MCIHNRMWNKIKLWLQLKSTTSCEHRGIFSNFHKINHSTIEKWIQKREKKVYRKYHNIRTFGLCCWWKASVPPWHVHSKFECKFKYLLRWKKGGLTKHRWFDKNRTSTEIETLQPKNQCNQLALWMIYRKSTTIKWSKATFPSAFDAAKNLFILVFHKIIQAAESIGKWAVLPGVRWGWKQKQRTRWILTTYIHNKRLFSALFTCLVWITNWIKTVKLRNPEHIGYVVDSVLI